MAVSISSTLSMPRSIFIYTVIYRVLPGIFRRKTMAQACSDDLRRKLLEAYEAGEGSLAELAVRFRVSVGWAKKIGAAMLRTGQRERPPGGLRGRKSRVTPEALEYLAGRVRGQPDRTLEKLREDPERDRGIALGVTQPGTVLKRMGLRFKKSRSAPRSRKRPASGSNVRSGSNPLRISTPHGSYSSTKPG